MGRVMALITILLASPASALDLGPRDGVPPPAGISGVSIEYSDRRFDGSLDINGLSLGATLDREAVNLRWGHSLRLAGRPAYFYGELPLVEYAADGAVTDTFDIDPGSGPGDLALAMAIWPYADRDASRYVGVAGYLLLPTGEYEAHRTFGANLNPGNNRVAGILQTGIHQGLGHGVALSVAADVMVFEDNDRYIGARLDQTFQPAAPGRLEVKPYYTGQASLSWQPMPGMTLASSYYIDRGGESRVDGGDWESAVNRERYGLLAQVALSRQWMVSASYKRPINRGPDFGLEEAAQLRLIHWF